MKLKTTSVTYTTLFLISLLGFTRVTGQQILLRARLGLQNSRAETGQLQYVPNASVSTANAIPTVSDDLGQAVLTVVGIEVGTPITVQVEHPSFEVVNALDLQQVILGRREPLLISLAPPGQLAMAQATYYKISKAALFAQRDATIAKLRGNVTQKDSTIQAIRYQFQTTLDNQWEAEELWCAKVEQLQADLDRIASELASVNLDLESERYRSAFVQFKIGNFEQVLVILDDSASTQAIKELTARRAALLAATEVDQAALEQVEALLSQEANNLSFKATVQNLLSRPQEAASSQEKALGVLNILDLPKGNPRLTRANYNLGRTYRQLARDREAIERQKAAIANLQAAQHPDTLRLVLSCADIATSLTAAGSLEESLQWQSQAVDLGAKILPAEGTEMGRLWVQYADLQLLNGAPDQALRAQQTAIGIFQADPNVDPSVLGSEYRTLASIYEQRGDLAKADTSIQRAIAIERSSLTPNKQELATSMEQAARLHRKQGDLSLAIQDEKAALSEMQQAEPQDHPRKANLLNELANLYLLTGRLDTALRFSKEANAMLDATLGPDHPAKGKFLQVQASIQLSSGQLEQAQKTLDQAIAIQLRDSSVTQQDLGESYAQLAEVQTKRGDYAAAAATQEQALQWINKAQQPDNKGLAEHYVNLALCHIRNGNAKGAIEAQQKAIDYLESAIGRSTPHLRDQRRYYENLGQVLFGMTSEEAELFARKRTNPKAN